MEEIPQFNDRRTRRYALGALMCWLLLVYAVGAKLALYHIQQPGAKSVAATKAWQDHSPSADIQIAPVHATPAVVNFVAVLLSLVFAVVWCLPLDESVTPRPRWFSPHLSVRPPPTF